MKPTAIDFAAPFDVQISQARAQGVKLSSAYYALQTEKRAQAFTVSGLTKLDQVQRVADELARAQASGDTLADFQKWAKTQDWQLPKHRLETIYRNSAQTAYQAGHWRDFEENAKDRPYLMYDAVNDSRVRPSHLALDGIIKPVGDAFWATRAAPMGHRCRCTLRSLTRNEAMAKGGVTQNAPAEGGPDPGWGHKPTEWGKTLEDLKAAKLAKAGPVLGRAAQQVFSAPQTVSDFIKAGRAITATLPDGAADAPACHAALLDLLKKEVGISTPCRVVSSGEGAKLVKQASQFYPDSWTEKTDQFGILYTKSSASTRGHATTTSTAPSFGNKYRLTDFGVVTFEQNAGYIMVRKGDVGNAVHEYAHRLQSALPELDKLFQELHTSRVAGNPVRRIKDVGPGYAHYSPSELTREDSYTNAYQGKEYGVDKLTNAARPGAALEVMTMGFESVLGVANGHSKSRIDFERMYTDDRDMFDFVVGVLRHWKP